MGLTKAELEEINEDLQMEIRHLKGENQSLRESLGQANERLEKLAEQYKQLASHYEQLRQYVIA